MSRNSEKQRLRRKQVTANIKRREKKLRKASERAYKRYEKLCAMRLMGFKAPSGTYERIFLLAFKAGGKYMEYLRSLGMYPRP